MAGVDIAGLSTSDSAIVIANDSDSGTGDCDHWRILSISTERPFEILGISTESTQGDIHNLGLRC